MSRTSPQQQQQHPQRLQQTKQNKQQTPKQNNTPILINTKRNSTPPSLFINITNTQLYITEHTTTTETNNQ